MMVISILASGSLRQGGHIGIREGPVYVYKFSPNGSPHANYPIPLHSKNEVKYVRSIEVAGDRAYILSVHLYIDPETGIPHSGYPSTVHVFVYNIGNWEYLPAESWTLNWWHEDMGTHGWITTQEKWFDGIFAYGTSPKDICISGNWFFVLTIGGRNNVPLVLPMM